MCMPIKQLPIELKTKISSENCVDSLNLNKIFHKTSHKFNTW